MGSLMEQARPRLAYFDNLKVALTILVIVHHVGQAYGPTGGAWPVDTETARSALLSPFFTVNRSFFMSLFFMKTGKPVSLVCGHHEVARDHEEQAHEERPVHGEKRAQQS